MNPLSVSCRKLCIVSHQLRNRKVNEKHLLIMENCLSLKRSIFYKWKHCTVICLMWVLYFVYMDSSVGIATGYSLDGSGIEFRWGGEIFRTCPDRFWGPPSLLYNEYRVSFPGVMRPGRGVDHPPHLVPRLKKDESYASTSPLGLRGLL
jgi:hypothetical protein